VTKGVEPAAKLAKATGSSSGPGERNRDDSERSLPDSPATGKHPKSPTEPEEPIAPPPAGGGRGRLPPPPPGRGRPVPSDEYPDDFRSSRDKGLEELIEDLTSDRPENQTAVDLSPAEREAFCDYINTLTARDDIQESKIYDPAGHDSVLFRSQELPENILARHGIKYSVVLTSHQPRGSWESEPPTYVIKADRQIRADLIEQKCVFFTRQTDGPGINVDEHAIYATPAGRGPVRPLTVAELRQIHLAIQDSLRDPQ
jgi:hypothetical protein